MVVRDHSGNLVFFGSIWGPAYPPQITECKAFAWAAQIALDHGWLDMDWRSDA